MESQRKVDPAGQMWMLLGVACAPLLVLFLTIANSEAVRLGAIVIPAVVGAITFIMWAADWKIQNVGKGFRRLAMEAQQKLAGVSFVKTMIAILFFCTVAGVIWGILR